MRLSNTMIRSGAQIVPASQGPMQLQHSLRDVRSCVAAHRIAVVHVEFAEHTYFLAELAAHRPDLLGQGCAEHEDLLAVRCCHEDLLHIAAHVCRASP
jgi:hypothetical protein